MSKTPKKFQNSHDPTFSAFAQEVAMGLEQNKAEDNGMSQRERFEELVGAERLFHETLINYRIHREMYKRFIQLIRVTNNNILSSRPFFRETSETFSAKITPALKARDPDALKEFAINFHFIKFCKDNWIGIWPKKLEMLYNRIEKARTILIRANLPLAINRAKLFYRKTPKGHVSFTDMIQMAAIGLSQGVDKYTGSFKANFVGVIIGRITGGLIDMYSETPIHFYPGDRRVLYRANSIRGRQGITDIAELTNAVNTSFTQDLKDGKTAPKQVTVSDLSYLMSAASMVSADSNDGEEGFGVYSYTQDDAENAEEALIRKQQISRIARLARSLPIINQKVLRLKGIDI